MKNFRFVLLCFLFLMMIAIYTNLNTGFLALNFSDFWSENTLHQEVIHLRINRVLVMILAGISIPTSGFLLQEYFRNPLAGPSILGVSSVASLSVAFYILFSKNLAFPEFLHQGMISFFAIGGSLTLLLLLLLFSRYVKDTSYIVIFGFLISALSGAVVSILQFYAENESLKSYILWSFGGNNQVTLLQIFILFCIILLGLILTFLSIKPLIGLSLGMDYAQSMGVNLSRLRVLIIIASSLLSASITAFLGPILFIGVIVPHFSRMLWNPSQLWHQWLLNMLLGVIIMELFSSLSENLQLPMNIITSLFGVPVILVMLLKRK